MIVEFSLASYRSFNRMQTLSFKATGLVSEDKAVDERNIVDENGTRCLKIAGLYGANGSGKSNVLEAFQFFTNMIVSSIETDELARYTMQPFIFASPEPLDGGYFQVIMILMGNKYRYGFTINNVGGIQSEWLFGPADKKETYYFKRTGDTIEINPERFDEGNNLPLDKLRADSLFLTFCSSYDGKISRLIRDYYKMRVTFDGNSRYPAALISRNKIKERATDILVEKGRENVVLGWLREAGMDYDDIHIDTPKSPLLEKVVYFAKFLYDLNRKQTGVVMLSLEDDESQGSQKFYRYIGELIQKFENGGIFVSDEIDNNFHPSLLKKIISLFQNSQINKSNAQLLFTSHDTNLMHPECMRRDQFYFAEKTEARDTKLYSLADLKGIRNNADFARQYLSGAYGALPILGNYIEETENNEEA